MSLDAALVARHDANDLRRRLDDPRVLCAALGLGDGARPQHRGVMIRCPWHEDRTPSCSVRLGADDTIAVRCHGCGATADALSLVAVVGRLDPRRDFARVLARAAEIAGVAPANPWRTRRPPPARPKLKPERTYPPADEVAELWAACAPVLDVADVAAWIRSRGLDPGAIEDRDLARAIPLGAPLPTWARYQGRTWAETGHLAVASMFDAAGVLRSLRARLVAGGDAPKSLPPAGHAGGGLTMADSLGRLLLAEGRRPDIWPERAPLRVVVAEGEPDFLTWATRFSDADEAAPAVFGIVAGSWTDAVGARMPDGARVTIRTHHDAAGEKYAAEIARTLAGRCTVLRGGTASAPEPAARGAA